MEAAFLFAHLSTQVHIMRHFHRKRDKKGKAVERGPGSSSGSRHTSTGRSGGSPNEDLTQAKDNVSDNRVVEGVEADTAESQSSSDDSNQRKYCLRTSSAIRHYLADV